jgi:hypothetical protein
MGSAAREHEAALAALPEPAWEDYLARHSGLPGPRGNLELLAAVGDLASADGLRAWAGSEDEYLAACGVAGLGRLVERPDDPDARRLRAAADDDRWRVREAVAMGLQRLGDRDPRLLRAVVERWADGGPLVQRAVVAGLCEPRLLHDGATLAAALDALDRATALLVGVDPAARRDPAVRTLRQGLGYAWSVAVAADPVLGGPRLERWLGADDPDVVWVLRENLRKARLTRADPALVERLRAAMDAAAGARS